MQATLGWTLLSKEALRQAENHLNNGDQAVRDEMGFLALHQAYADRFFPGTSVQQTRLRYILFVPWLYQQIAEKKDRKPITRTLQEEELNLVERLKRTNGTSVGVIGERSYPKPTSQPPSIVYWSALSAWGLLHPRRDGSYPDRAFVHRTLSSRRSSSQLHDDDKQPLEDHYSFFVDLPGPPEEWKDRNAPLPFRLLPLEAKFVRQQLIGVNRPGMLTTPSLMSRLAEKRVDLVNIQHPWLYDVIAVADAEDKCALERAQQAAALAAVGRGVYAALVERICVEEDKRPLPNIHRARLDEVVAEYGREAIKLDVATLSQDTLGLLPQRILEIVRETQHWLTGSRSLKDLRNCYEVVEINRKGLRARLARTPAGRERRGEWDPEKHTLADALHYRWGRVRQLLTDLREAAQ